MAWRVTASCEHLERANTLYCIEQHRSLVPIMERTWEYFPSLCGVGSVVSWFPEKALKSSSDAIALAQQLPTL